MAEFQVDVAAKAHSLGLEIYAVELPEGVSGMIKRDKSFNTRSEFVIFVDKDEPNARQRFTAAHEIGHYELHKDFIGNGVEDNYLLRSSNLSNQQEVEANKYAADLLMPYDKIHEAMKQGNTTVKSLALLFGVSGTAMAIRLGMPT